MRQLKIILPLIALAFIGYQLYDYYDASQQNEVMELNNQVVDELVALQDYVGGVELQIMSIFDPDVELTPAHYDLLDLLKGGWEGRFAGARASLDDVKLPDTPEADALRAEGHKFIDAFKATMLEYDELIDLIVAQVMDYDQIKDYAEETILILQVDQLVAIDAFTAAQEAYLAE